MFGSRVVRMDPSIIGIRIHNAYEESLLRKELSNCNRIDFVSYRPNDDGTSNFYIYESCDR